MINVEQYLTFLVTNKLTQQQFMFLELLYLKSFKLLNLYREMVHSTSKDIIGINERKDLIDRGFLIHHNEGKNFTDFELTNKFLAIFVDEFRAGNEFWDLYPAFVQSNGKTLPLTLMDKNEFRKIYFKAINGDREEHDEVKKDLRYAIDNGLIKGKIDKFVLSEQWTQIRKLRLGKADTVVTFKVEDNEF